MSSNDLIPALHAPLVGALLQSTAYGIFLVLCIKSLSVLFANKRWCRMHQITLSITIFQLVLITGHWCLNISRLFDGFIYAQDLPTGTIRYYSTVAHPKCLSFTALYIIQGIVTDCFMVYRMFIIWGGSKWICAFPVLTVLATTITGPGIIITFSRLTAGDDVFVSMAQPYILISLASNLCTNLYCSLMITYRIWTSERRLIHLGVLTPYSTRLTRTMHIIIDSAGIFTVVTFSAFVAYVLKSNFHLICIDVATPTVGIAFCLILVRVGGRVDQVSTITSQQTIQRIKSDDVTPSQRTEVALSPISSVQITKEVHSDSELDVTKPSVELA